jgi:hypothetical protein
MLALVGAFNAAEGLVELYGGGTWGVEGSRMMFLDPLMWGRVSVALGGLLLVLGVWLWMVTVRVRLAVVVPAVVLHGLAQVGVLAAYPIWALLMIAFDVVIIFALTVTPASAARFGGPGVANSRDDYRPRHLLTPVTATVVLGPLPGIGVVTGAAGVVPRQAVAAVAAIAAAPAGAPTARIRAVVPLPWAGVAARPPIGDMAAPPPLAETDMDAPPPAELVRPWARTMAGSEARSQAGVVAHPNLAATAKAAAMSARSGTGGGAPILGAISGRCPDTPLQV